MENDLSYFFLVNLSSLTAPINIPSLNKRAEEVSPLLTPSVYLFLLAIIYYFKQSLNITTKLNAEKFSSLFSRLSVKVRVQR